jgi:iron-sulfur cluster assembly protein
MLTFTPEAEIQIKSLIEKGGYSALRLSMKKYGCSGMSYDLDGVMLPVDGDLKIEVAGCNFFVEASAQEFLNGCEVDYNKGIFGEGFVFNNPNHKGGCGCGKSFTF